MITKEQVLHVAKLARIKISDEEADRFQGEFSDVLEYFDELAKADTEGVVLEKDESGHSFIRDDVSVTSSIVEKLSERTKEGFVKVKAILRQ